MVEGIVKVKVFRYNPETDLCPSYRFYEVSVNEKMMVLQVLKAIYENQDRTLAFRRFSCGFKFCNSCMMTINGKPAHACMTVVEPGEELVVEPYQEFPVIRDLVVDFGQRVVTPDGAFLLQQGAMVKRVDAK